MTDQQNVEIIVKDVLNTANAKMALPVSLKLKACKLEENVPVIKLSICKRDAEKDEVGYIVCKFGDKGSINSYSTVENIFPVVSEGNSTWALLSYIEIYLGYREEGYGKHALNVFHCFVDTLGSDFTFLDCNSHAPYAGHAYKKVGYEFLPSVLMASKTWGQEKGIENGQEEIEFLKDTSRRHTRELGSLYMFRQKNKIG